MNKTQIEQIKEMLIEKNLYGWKIELAEIARTNMYFTKFLEPEEIMNSNRTHIVITIYKDYGDARFTFFIQTGSNQNSREKIT